MSELQEEEINAICNMIYRHLDQVTIKELEDDPQYPIITDKTLRQLKFESIDFTPFVREGVVNFYFYTVQMGLRTFTFFRDRARDTVKVCNRAAIDIPIATDLIDEPDSMFEISMEGLEQIVNLRKKRD